VAVVLKIEQLGVTVGVAIREERNLSELDLIQLAQEGRAQISALIGQTIAITFAMVVGIYYFLNRAGLVLKLASFVPYTLGMLMYYGLMIVQSNLMVGAITGLRALPAEGLSPIGQAQLAWYDSPASDFFTIISNASIWALGLIVIYLLFFWKKPKN
jgi:hypothetical protein